jgi:hypothetical protein
MIIARAVKAASIKVSASTTQLALLPFPLLDCGSEQRLRVLYYASMQHLECSILTIVIQTVVHAEIRAQQTLYSPTNRAC